MGGIAPPGTIPPEPSGARPKRPRGFSCGPALETSEPEAIVAARLMRRRVVLVAGRPSGLSPKVGAVAILSPNKRINRQRQTSALAAALGRPGARLSFPAASGGGSFLSPSSDSASVPVVLPGPKRLGPFFPWRLLFSPRVEEIRSFRQMAKRSNSARQSARPEEPSLSLSVLSRAVLCGNEERTEARRCGARIAGTN